MTCVIDASMALSWVLADEFGPRSQQVLDGVSRHGAIVPALWHFEVANGLRSAERRGRITEGALSRALLGLAGLPIAQADRRADGQRLVDLARQFDLSVYDAAYLSLAIDENLPLATLDTGLADAGGRAGVEVV